MFVQSLLAVETMTFFTITYFVLAYAVMKQMGWLLMNLFYYRHIYVYEEKE